MNQEEGRASELHSMLLGDLDFSDATRAGAVLETFGRMDSLRTTSMYT